MSDRDQHWTTAISKVLRLVSVKLNCGYFYYLTAILTCFLFEVHLELPLPLDPTLYSAFLNYQHRELQGILLKLNYVSPTFRKIFMHAT